MRRQRCERARGEVRVEDVKVRIGGESTLQVRARRHRLTQTVQNHASVEKQARILRPELESFVHGGERFLEATVLVEGPGQHVVRVNILSYFKFFLRQGQGRLELHVVVEVKQYQLTIVQDLMETSEIADVFDEGVLLPGVLQASEPGIEVSQGRSVVRQRDNRQRLLIEIDGLLERRCAARTWARPARAR